VDDAGVLVDAKDYYRAFYESARGARRSILMSGWQFDSGVRLLRGTEAPLGAEVRFLKFLNGLCHRRPELEIYILAWDFHIALALEREWLQRLYFQWMTHARFRFLFDDCPVPGGSHHQKFVVVDGTHAFLGGMDVCESRWDDRRHRGDNPLRRSRGAQHKPYHDVQAYLAGREVAAVLAELFWERWRNAGGERSALPVDERALAPPPPRGLLPIGSERVALSRTQPCAEGEGDWVREVERLFVDAIAAAQRLIYIETQYLSSRRICDALAERMQRRPRLEIVIVVNERAEALKEELAVGLRQAEILERVRAVAASTGQALGLHYSVCDGPTESFRATYIHSKVLIVDDRFLSVGSANMTNRSMGIDSELHASWEAAAGDGARLVRAIRRIRVSLLAEHGGFSGPTTVRQLVAHDGLVERLNALSTAPGARLLQHGPPRPLQAAAMEVVDPQSLPFDPDTSPEAGTEPPLGTDEPDDESSRASITGALGSMGQVVRRFLRRGPPVSTSE